MTDRIIDRDILQEEYIRKLVDNMSTEDLIQIVTEELQSEFNKYTFDELIGEVEENKYDDLIDIATMNNDKNENQCDTSISGTRYKHCPPYALYYLHREGNKVSTPLTSTPIMIMRKIEQQMCRAIQKNINWQSANTSVHYNEESGVSIVRLHGNKIAEIDDTTMTIYDGGHQTRTTKSRLNALCDEFCIAGEGVFQKDFEWFIRKCIHQSKTTGKVYNVEDFSNGFTFA